MGEPFAEIDVRRVMIEWLAAATFATGPTPLDAQTDRHHELMFWVLDDAVFKGRTKVLKAVRSHPRRTAGRLQAGEGRTKRHRERLGDAIGTLRRNIALSDRWIVAGVEIGN